MNTPTLDAHLLEHYHPDYLLLKECKPAIIFQIQYGKKRFTNSLAKLHYNNTPDEALINVLCFALEEAQKLKIIKRYYKRIPFCCLVEAGEFNRSNIHMHSILFDDGSYDIKQMVNFLNGFICHQYLKLNYKQMMQHKRKMVNNVNIQKAYLYDTNLEPKGSMLKYICKREKHIDDPLWFKSAGLIKQMERRFYE